MQTLCYVFSQLLYSSRKLILWHYHGLWCIINPRAYYKVTSHWWSQAYEVGCHGNVSHLSALSLFFPLSCSCVWRISQMRDFKSVCVLPVYCMLLEYSHWEIQYIVSCCLCLSHDELLFNFRTVCLWLRHGCIWVRWIDIWIIQIKNSAF